MANFLAMGGYADFVWPAYAASFAVLLAATAVSLRALARAKASVRRLEAEVESGESP